MAGEAYYSHWAVIFIVFTLFVVVTKLFLFLINNKNKKIKNVGKTGKLPPGGRGWLFIGDSVEWFTAVASSHPPRFVEQQVKRYGKIFSCKLFGKRAIVSADPEFNRLVMLNEGRLFQSSYPKSFRDLVGKNGIITVQGDKQRKLHAIASNVMRLDKVQSLFLEDIQRVVVKTVDGFRDGQVILLQDVCRKVAINLMVNQLLGVSDEDEVDEMARLFSNFVDGCLSLPVNLPGFSYHTGMKAREAIIKKINKTIEMHRNEEHHDINGCNNNGVLRRLLDEEDKISDNAIADFIINLLFAGNETTAKTMLFAVYYLTHSPTALQHFLDEHKKLRNKKRDLGIEDPMLTWQDYKEMTFTQCVIDETLRLGGIAIWLMREAKEDIEYQGYLIPKGCFVVPFLSAVHLDPSLYDSPLCFNPWRWMDPQNQEKRNWRKSPFFTPFGGGARFCPGAELARLQIAIFLHYFVTTYRWKQTREDRISFFPSARLANGFQIQLAKRMIT
ncbi:abietadienol/abietadienal oxidase [Impatiens glandulifera]|uniref:abietadienol/abietadienal oxidase n=1 Tax=Impatiens glandulifera TaxID=253017 RepID=UPI001FB061CF|nr:abietadienol/abietadienal oxidase [Impatiens glandulifera]